MTVRIGAPLPPASDVASTNAALRVSMSTLLDQVQQDYPHPAGEYWVPYRLGGSAPTLADADQMDADEASARAARRSQPQA